MEMNSKQEKRYYEIKRELDKIVPNQDYQNSLVAKAVALGKFNEGWLVKSLILCIEDGFIGYDEALALKKMYMNFLG